MIGGHRGRAISIDAKTGFGEGGLSILRPVQPFPLFLSNTHAPRIPRKPIPARRRRSIALTLHREMNKTLFAALLGALALVAVLNPKAPQPLPPSTATITTTM